MTTIRKIVTSKIDGSDANNTSTDEIRPFGETNFYVDSNGPTDKLVLSIHDGVRTHLKSKVLAPGVLYGSNSDSGDGAGLDTIKLIPDVEIYNNNGSDQYIIIDPTAPNHVHIRAGGTIDNSNADLYLGGELTHVKVSDGYDNVVIRTSVVGEGITPYEWTFDNSGSLTVPKTVYVDNSSLDGSIVGNDGVVIRSPSARNILIAWEKGTVVNPYPEAPPGVLDAVTANIMLGYGGLSVEVNQEGAGGYWTFQPNQKLKMPPGGDIVDTNGVSVLGGRVVSVPGSSTGAVGDKQSDLASNGTHFYYCTQDFPTTYEATLYGGYSGSAYPSIAKGSYPQPQVGWTFVWNLVTYTVVGATDPNPGEWSLEVDQTIDTLGGGIITLTPPGGNIWRRVAWSNDTW